MREKNLLNEGESAKQSRLAIWLMLNSDVRRRNEASMSSI
jgi:hypothetical protein